MAIALDSEESPFKFPSFGELAIGVILGTLFISFSFPVGLEKLAIATGWPVFAGLGSFSRSELSAAFGASPTLQTVSFYTLWTACLLGVGGYLVALALLSLRHLRFDLFGLGIVFLAIGAASLHIVTWTIWLIGWLLHIVAVIFGFFFQILGIALGWLFNVLRPVFSFFGNVFGAIFGFFGNVFGTIFGFLIKSGLWPFALVLVVGILIFVLVRYWEDLKDLLEGGFSVVVIGVIVGIAFLLLRLIWPFLKAILEFLGKAVGFIGRILVPVFIVLLVGWIVYGIGAILMDTFRGAWHSGNGRRGVIIGSLSVGTLLAIILMETNVYNITAYYPPFFSGFAVHYLHISLPLVDVLVCLLVLCTSILGAFRNVPRMQAEIALRRFQTGFFMISLALIVALIFVAIGSAAEGGSS